MAVAPMELTELVTSASSNVGNLFAMIPRSMHAFLLRNSLSVLSVTYVNHLPGGYFFSHVVFS